MILVAKTFAGCESILAEELAQLGATNIRELTRAVEFEGDQGLMYKANLHCRTALRILKPYTTFEASDEEMLYENIQAIDWSEHFSLEQTFAINTTLNLSNMTHSQYVSLKAKDAIVDQFRDKYDDRPNVDTEQPDLRIHLHIYDNQCTLSFDSSGESLHKRGYRDYTNQAPLNEALAAALVITSGWDKESTLADYMCGSGTILIEAAMIMRNIAPNKFKHRFGFETWKDWVLIAQMACLAVAPRSLSPQEDAQAHEWHNHPQIKYTLLDMALENVSATDIRSDLKNGRHPGQALKPSVFQYIQHHHLYLDRHDRSL